MKIFIIVALVVASVPGICQQSDPVKAANTANEKKADSKMLDEEVAAFLVKAADARMMDSQEGAMAAKRGTISSIKSYGKMMVTDQAKMLAKIKTIAKKKKISLPDGISNKKEDGREDLSKETGKDFDQKFIKMMVIDHKRDIRQFSDAAKFSDKEVSAFARQYLPLIKTHLEKIEIIREAEFK